VTTATTPADLTAELEAKRPGFNRLLIAEWTKIRSVRSTIWTLLLFVIVTIGFTTLFMALTEAQWNKQDASQKANIIADPMGSILGSGLFLGQLTICVLGCLVITSEYSTGMIRASLLAVPRRVPMLAAKAMVFAAVVFVVGLVVSFVSFFIGQAILHAHVSVSLSQPGVARAVIGADLFLTVLGLFALAIGAIIRHSAGAITTVIGFVLVLAPLAQLLPGSLGKHVHAFLPSEAGHSIVELHKVKGDILSPWQGFGVFCAWTALLMIIGIVMLKRRDA